MPPIQSRRSRKLRETAYVNGQHSNVLKEISNPGKDGTIPLLNFLENTERFIADTNILYARVNDLEREQDRVAKANKRVDKMVEYLKQLTETLNELLPEDVEQLNFTSFLANLEDTTQEAPPVEKEPSNYFKPNESKRAKHPFPNFSNEHTIKINIGTDVALTDVETPEIHVLSHSHTKKGTIEMSIYNEIHDDDYDNQTKDINTLGYIGTRKNGLELPVTLPRNTEDSAQTANEYNTLLNQSRGMRRKQRLYDSYELTDMDEQLHKDSEKVEHLLRKLKRNTRGTMSLVNHEEDEEYDEEDIRYELDDDYADATFTVANVREELLAKRRSRRNRSELSLTKPYITKQEVVQLHEVKQEPAISKPRRRGTQRLLDPTVEKELLVIHEKGANQVENTLQRLKQKSRVLNPRRVQELHSSQSMPYKDINHPLATPGQQTNEIKLKLNSKPLSLLGRSKARSMKLREMQKQNEEMNAILDEEMRELDAIRAMLLEEDD
jgi:hypothetical protein